MFIIKKFYSEIMREKILESVKINLKYIRLVFDWVVFKSRI